MEDALASRGDEGRDRLRKAVSRCRITCDPQMSEWGNPIIRRKAEVNSGN